jgi:predicted DNA-binding transcriptional regulator AlpA
LTPVRKNLVTRLAQPPVIVSGQTEDLYRELGRAVAPLLSIGNIENALVGSSERRRVAADLLAELAIRIGSLDAIAERENRRQQRRRVPDVLPRELMRSRIFDTSEAAAFCGFSVAHWRRLYRTGKAPKPVQLSTRKLGWRAGDLVDWLQSRLDSS